MLHQIKLPKEGNEENQKKLSLLEERGWAWLKKMTAEEKISICQADKGGAILLVPPSYLENKVDEKLSDNTLYKEIKRSKG